MKRNYDIKKLLQLHGLLQKETVVEKILSTQNIKKATDY